MSHAENLNGFNVPEQTPNQEKDKKQVSRRGLLIGLGAGAAALIGGGAATGGYLAGRGNEAPTPTPEPKPPVETETPTPAETETPVETAAEQETPTTEELFTYLYEDKEVGGIGPDVSSEEITEHFKLTGSDIEVGNEEQIEQKLNDALALMLNGAPRSSKLALEAQEYALQIMSEDPDNYSVTDLAYEYFENVSRDNALAVLNGLVGEDWRFRSRSSETEQSLEHVVDYGKRSLINWYISGMTNGVVSDEDMYQQYFDKQPRPDLFEFTVDPRSTDTREVSIDTKIESEFDVRAKNMQPEDIWPSNEQLRDDLFDLAGVKFGVELYVDQAASDEAGYVVGRVSLRDNYA